METYNQHFNKAWEYLELYHAPSLNKSKPKWDSFPYNYTLDMSFKPAIKKAEWKRYIDAIATVLAIGRRENLLTFQVDGWGYQVWWIVAKKPEVK